MVLCNIKNLKKNLNFYFYWLFNSSLQINFFFILNFYKDVYFFILPLKLLVVKQAFIKIFDKKFKTTFSEVLKKRCMYFLFLNNTTNLIH